MKKIKTIKKISIVLIALAAVCFTSCASTQFEQTEFEKQTGIMLIVPMRVFTWVNADGAKTFMKDYSTGKITFEYSEENNFIVKVENIDGVLKTTWGKQFTDIDENIRSLISTAFIASCYSMDSGKDGINTAFDVMYQIFSDKIYEPRKKLLNPTFEHCLGAYKNAADWNNYKFNYFSTKNNTFTVIK